MKKLVVYYTFNDRPISNAIFWEYLESVEEDVRRRILRFKRWQDAQATLFGRILMIKAFREFMQDTLVNVEYDQYNRPRTAIQGFDFNISHSGGVVVVAVSEGGRIGIDAEEIREMDFTEFESQLNVSDISCICGSADPAEAFFQIWTKKEAVSKADGRGLELGFKDIFLSGSQASVEGKTWHLTELFLRSRYVAHLASEFVLCNHSILIKELKLC